MRRLSKTGSRSWIGSRYRRSLRLGTCNGSWWKGDPDRSKRSKIACSKPRRGIVIAMTVGILAHVSGTTALAFRIVDADLVRSCGQVSLGSFTDAVCGQVSPGDTVVDGCKRAGAVIRYWIDTETKPTNLSLDEVRGAISRVARAWGRTRRLHTRLTFVEEATAPDPLINSVDGVVVIYWEKTGELKRRSRWGETPAYCDVETAELAPGPDIKLDGSSDTLWVVSLTQSLEGFYLPGALAHEFGHVLGLGESDSLGATMAYPIGQLGTTLLRAQFVTMASPEGDDQSGVQYLYGKNQFPTLDRVSIVPGNAVDVGETVEMRLFARDAEGDRLRFQWIDESGLGYLASGCGRRDSSCLWRAPSEPGSYKITAGVRDVKHQGFLEHSFTVLVGTPTANISVSLDMSPSIGVPPLTVDSSAVVAGAALGDFRFRLYCDWREGSTPDTQWNWMGIRTVIGAEPVPLAVPGACSYQRGGTYVARIVVNQGTALQAEARATVVVAECNNSIREGDEQCDSSDDTACPGLCQPDCMCAPTPTPTVTPTPTTTPSATPSPTSACGGACPGTIVDVTGVTGVTSPRPRVKVDASGNAVIVWQDRRSGTDEIYWTTVNRFGAKTAPDRSLTAETFPATLPDHGIDSAGNIYLAFQAGSDIRLAGAAPDGTRRWGGNTVLLCSSCSNPAVVSEAGGRTHIAYEQNIGGVGPYRVYYANVLFDAVTATWSTTTLSTRDVIGIVKTPSIDLGTDGNRYVAWRDFDSSFNYAIWHARLTGGSPAFIKQKWGSNVDKPVIRLFRDTSAVWVHFEDSVGAGRQIYNATGSNVATQWSQGAGPATNPRMANRTVSGTDILATVWEDARSGTKRIYRRLRNANEVLVSDPGDEAIFPDVAAGTNGDFYVVWAQGPAGSRHIYWTRITP